MKRTRFVMPIICVSLLFVAVSVAYASVPPGAILRPAGLQWYVRGAHNTVLDEYFVVWADAGVNQIRGMRLTASGARHPTDPDPRGVDITGPNIAPDVAYNKNANEYLAVWADGGLDNGDIWGVFLDGNTATAIGNAFVIFRSGGEQTLPRLEYSATDNVYLVVWTSRTSAGGRVLKQTVAGSSSVPTLLGAPLVLESTNQVVIPHSAVVDWNAFTNKFLVVWTSQDPDDLVRGQFFNGDGTVATPLFTVVNEPGVKDKNASVAANSTNGEFLVTYDRSTTVPSLNVNGLILDSNGTRVTNVFNIATTPDIPDWRSHAAYNRFANTYFVTWVTGRLCGGGASCDDVLGRAIAPDGTVGGVIGVANDNAIQTHGAADGFMSWGDLIPSTTEPKFFELYQVGGDDINGGIVPFGAVAPPDPPPFGSFDLPTDGATGIAGSVAVTGWALDDIEVTDVKIYRDPVAGEGTSLVFIGDAVFVEGARPDIEAAYPGVPNNTRAGWGYMMLTYGLPNLGNGTWVFHARATDSIGQVVTLGTKTITVDNANSVLPFGTIDTPAQGGTTSGIYRNWGWVLTPQPNIVPVDGSTIEVYVDNVLRGTLNYGLSRPDIQAAFPAYQNTDTAVGYFDLDTTAYTDGVHTIGWFVTDSAGNQEGIGSRFFVIDNNP